MAGPFIIPQQIFDFSSVAISGADSPNRIQDSGPINVAVGPGWTEIFAALLGNSLFWNIMQVTAIPGANVIELATGAIGVETPLFHMSVPPDAATFGWTLFQAPFVLPLGMRISMRSSAIIANVETHMLYRL